MTARIRRTATILVLLLVALAPAGVTAAVAAPATFASLHVPGPPRPVPPPSARGHDPHLPTAVVVLGNDGAVVSDVLGPYEVLAASGRFNLYTAAPRREPVPLTGGLDLVPDLTLDEVSRRTGPAGPDLLVVPALPADDTPAARAVAGWVAGRSAAGTTLLGVCNGAGLLASAGVLDGRPATAHWSRLGRLRSAFDRVGWVEGRRFVDDGDVVTTGGILSGLDGTLHLVERFAGRDAADRAAAAVGWHRHPGDAPVHAPGGPDPAAILNAGYRLDPDRIGVVLTPGVGELELASVFDVHGGQSLAGRTVALGTAPGAVRSRHGLTFLPRAVLADAAVDLDRLLVPGRDAAADRAVPAPERGPLPEYPHRGDGFAFDDTIADVARTMDRATATWAAKASEMPTDGVRLDGAAWPWTPSATLLALLVGGVLLARGAAGALRAVRRSARHGGGDGTSRPS
ncbi:DJ-1/PfpI family protein [Pseudonocardia endophytica]|uniref:DJ-1/PfpI family protein n=1 Tax=Pseudonocardia endophytica TaxID=401976 RepID=A0A4R1HXM8_PSEEN|nr:DJ-1/PfpI family protein [Pseudonocardia endophytica]TCK26241.1 DJ-1/PfpI family protein [Pseudonocardia endophytica]